MGSGYFEVALSENEVINFRGIYIFIVISIYGNLCIYIIYIYTHTHLKLHHFPTNPLCIPLLNGISTQRGTPDGFFTAVVEFVFAKYRTLITGIL